MTSLENKELAESHLSLKKRASVQFYLLKNVSFVKKQIDFTISLLLASSKNERRHIGYHWYKVRCYLLFPSAAPEWAQCKLVLCQM